MVERARDADDRTVGVCSAGPRAAEVKLRELQAVGIVGWLELVQLPESAARTFNVRISADDVHRLDGWDGLFASAEIIAAAQEDREAHAMSSRQSRPWAETWWDDVDEDRFVALVMDRMTVEQAERLREHMVEGSTWRGAAAFCHAEFSKEWRLDWIIVGHQSVGRLMCVVAAAKLGEDDTADVWM